MRGLYSEECKRTALLENAFTEIKAALGTAKAEARTAKEQLAESDARAIGKLLLEKSLHLPRSIF